MTDDGLNKARPHPARGHYVPDREWPQVVADADEFRRQLARLQPPETEGEDVETDDELPNARRLLSGAVVPRRLVPVVDWTARGIACKKYFGVSGIPTQLLVLHSAECPLQGGYAQSLTNWALTTAVQASWHRFVDPLCRVYMIPDELGAWHASEANSLSIGWEQAGYAAYTRAQWTTPDGLKQLDSLAYDMAMVARRDGIPARWLTDAEVRAVLDSGNRSIKGFCLHRQIDPETRTDPGNGYPYDLLMNAIKKYLAPAPTPPKDWFDMATQAQLEASIKKVVEPLFRNQVWAYKGSQAKDAFWHLVYGTWAKTINRGGKQISALQELADTKTIGLRNEVAIQALTAKVDALLAASPAKPPAQLARPEDIEDAVVEDVDDDPGKE